MKYPFLKFIRNTKDDAFKEANRLNEFYAKHTKPFIAEVKQLSSGKYGVYIEILK